MINGSGWEPTDMPIAYDRAPDGDVAVRDSQSPTDAVLTFTPTQWDVFLDRVRDGEFDRERLRDVI